MSQLISPPAQNPRRVFYVSPSYTGTSPYFNTIENAIAACDGVNSTTIFIHDGIYTINNDAGQIFIKHNTHLIGINSSRSLQLAETLDIGVVIKRTANLLLFNNPSPANEPLSVTFENLSFSDTLGNGSEPHIIFSYINANAGSVRETSFVNCVFQRGGIRVFAYAGIDCKLTINGLIANVINLSSARPYWSIKNIHNILTGSPLLYDSAAIGDVTFPLEIFDSDLIGSVLCRTGRVIKVSNSIIRHLNFAVTPQQGKKEYYNCEIIIDQAIPVPTIYGNDDVRFVQCYFSQIGGITGTAMAFNDPSTIARFIQCYFRDVVIRLDGILAAFPTLIFAKCIASLAGAGVTLVMQNAGNPIAIDIAETSTNKAALVNGTLTVIPASLATDYLNATWCV